MRSVNVCKEVMKCSVNVCVCGGGVGKGSLDTVSKCVCRRGVVMRSVNVCTKCACV